MSEITSGPARSWHDVYRAQTARIHDLETEIAALRKIIDQQDAEIVTLQEAVRWLDLHRGELPSLMNPGAYAAYIRAMEEER